MSPQLKAHYRLLENFLSYLLQVVCYTELEKNESRPELTPKPRYRRNSSPLNGVPEKDGTRADCLGLAKSSDFGVHLSILQVYYFTWR